MRWKEKIQKMKFFEFIDEQSVSESIRFQSDFSFSEYENESSFEAIKIDFVFQVGVSMVKLSSASKTSFLKTSIAKSITYSSDLGKIGILEAPRFVLVNGIRA
jgi:hypothetical protein